MYVPPDVLTPVINKYRVHVDLDKTAIQRGIDGEGEKRDGDTGSEEWKAFKLHEQSSHSLNTS